MTDNDNSATYRDPFAPGDDPRRKRGRGVGSRAKLAKRFFEDTYAAWEEQGPSVLARAAFHDPVAFANMVARLMPQKIEVSTPTDGLSDERLAELLDFAERMAGLKAEQAKVLQGDVITATLPSPAQALQPASVPPHKLADENGLCTVSPAEGGGGRCAEMGGGGENTSSTLRADPAETTSPEFNALRTGTAQSGGEQNRHCTSCGVALKPHEIELCDRCGAPSVLPYPVGKPGPKPDHLVERSNRAALAEGGRNDRETDIDPESLF